MDEKDNISVQPSAAKKTAESEPVADDEYMPTIEDICTSMYGYEVNDMTDIHFHY